MYDANKPWESEHDGYFNKGKDKQYHKEDKTGYNSGGDISSDYMRGKEGKQKDDEKKDSFFEDFEEKKDEKLKDDEIPFKAAKQVFQDNQREEKKEHKKKNLNSIEEAIKKAVEDEKKVIMLD